MPSKPPTPQGISALLRKAGFERSLQREFASHTAGFRVRAGRDTRIAPGPYVRVRWWPDSSYQPAIPGVLNDRRATWLAKYARVLTTAGWPVEVRKDCLIVTARED